MSTAVAAKPQQTFKTLLSSDNIKKKFEEILKDNASAFTANLAVIVNNNAELSQCEPISTVMCAIVAASLNLQLDPNIGQSAIIAYNSRQKDGTFVKKAQFQIMKNGWMELAQRTGRIQKIEVQPIYDGEFISSNRVTGDYIFDFTAKKSETIIGYTGYIKLIEGFEKTVYWTIEQFKAHGQFYSKTYNNPNGLWNKNFPAMCEKTMYKHLIVKYAPKSINSPLAMAIKTDQASFKTPKDETLDIEPIYIDNSNESFEDANIVNDTEHGTESAATQNKTMSAKDILLKQSEELKKSKENDKPKEEVVIPTTGNVALFD